MNMIRYLLDVYIQFKKRVHPYIKIGSSLIFVGLAGFGISTDLKIFLPENEFLKGFEISFGGQALSFEVLSLIIVILGVGLILFGLYKKDILSAIFVRFS